MEPITMKAVLLAGAIGIAALASGLISGPSSAANHPREPLAASVAPLRPTDDTGSALTDEEADDLTQYHNKVRKDVGIGPVTTEIGAGKAIIRAGERKGWLVIVCNYDPPGNITGEKPY
jgi:hypothetical protein